MPYFDTELIEEKTEKNPVTDLVQLSYVLPKASLNMLPKRVEARLLQQYGHLYRTDYEFKWAYCKYFWEGHVEFPSVKIEDLEILVHDKQ